MTDFDRKKLKFHDKLLESVTISKNELHYNPTYFLRMLGELGCLETAKQLIMSKTYSEGFTKMWEYGRLDLTVEAIALQKDFEGLFTTEVLKVAEKKLRDCGFVSPK